MVPMITQSRTTVNRKTPIFREERNRLCQSRFPSTRKRLTFETTFWLFLAEETTYWKKKGGSYQCGLQEFPVQLGAVLSLAGVSGVLQNRNLEFWVILGFLGNWVRVRVSSNPSLTHKNPNFANIDCSRIFDTPLCFLGYLAENTLK